MNMSGWFMWTLAGIFENIGVVQESMMTIARPFSVVDAEDAKPLEVKRGAIEFDDVSFDYGHTRSPGDGKPGGVIQNLSLQRGAGREGRPRRALGRRQVDARRRCCCASTTWSRAASSSTARTSRTSPRTACAARSAS